MEVKPGYKRTEVGVIPEDWEAGPLRSVCSMKSGFGITSRDIDDFGHYPCYGGNGLRGFTSKFTHNGAFALIGRQGALCGNVLGVEGSFFASEHAVVVTANDRTDIKWLTCVLGQLALGGYSESSAQPGLSVEKLRAIDIAIPSSKREQQTISGVLADTDALIASLDRLIAKKRDLKHAAMQQLLTGKTRLPGFSGQWEVMRLGDFGSFSKGSGLSKDDLVPDGPVPAVPYTSIYTDFDEVIDSSNIRVFTHRKRNLTLINDPHVLIAGSSNMLENIGKATAFTGGWQIAVGGDVLLYRCSLDVRFISYLLSTPAHRKRIVSLAQGSTIRHVYSATFHSYEVIAPAAAEQAAIANAVSDMDSEIKMLEQRREGAGD